MKKECVAMLLAGGQGSRLYVLTGNMAKPAVPFGGKFRIIDFPLSNCTNSGIDTVGVLTQYRPLELNSYIGSGQPWELDRMSGGVHILPPYQSATGAVWYKGTANAIYQNRGFVDLYDPEYVLVLSGDHIYKMDYSDMLRRHKEAGAACTISVMEVPWEEASRFGIMSVDEQDRITEFAEKPREPKSNLASMGIYIFTWSKLKAYLAADEADPNSDNDFGKNIIPAMLSAGLPVGRQYGYAVPGLGPEPAGQKVAHLRPHPQLPAHVRGAGGRHRQQRRGQGLHHSGRGEEHRPELRLLRGGGGAGVLLRGDAQRRHRGGSQGVLHHRGRGLPCG